MKAEIKGSDYIVTIHRSEEGGRIYAAGSGNIDRHLEKVIGMLSGKTLGFEAAVKLMTSELTHRDGKEPKITRSEK